MLALMQVEYAPKTQFWIFLALFLGFGIKVPMLLVHGSARRRARGGAHRGQRHPLRAPAETGAPGLLRFCLPMLPEASVAFAPLIQGLSVLANLDGGAMALAQPDFKRLIAYSSIAHMGFVTLGIFGLNNSKASRAPSSKWSITGLPPAPCSSSPGCCVRPHA